MAISTLENEGRLSIFDRPIASVFALTWEKVLYGALIVAAFITRFYNLGQRVMSHDESLHTQFGWYLWQGRGFQHSPLMHGVLRFELTAFSYWLFGDNDFTSRIFPALMGVVAVGLMFYYRRWLGRTGALVAALLMLISPFMLYYTRYLRDEPYVIVWGLLTALCVIRYLETRENRYLYWLAAVTALFYTTMEASYIYIAITMLFLGLHLLRELFVVRWPNENLRRPFWIAFAIFGLALLVAGASLIFQRTGIISGTQTAVPANPTAVPTPGAAGASMIAAVVPIAAVVAVVAALVGTALVVVAFGKKLRHFAVIDVLMVLGLFVLPQLTAFPVLALRRDPLNYTLPAVGGLGAFLTSDAGVTATVCLALIALTILIGWLWDLRRFLICAAIFYSIFFTLFTTFFTNGAGMATGLIGSLAYWLAQHGVERGSQPLYYYLVINLPLYEFLPTIGALFAAGIGLAWWLGYGRPPVAAEAAEGADATTGELIDPAAVEKIKFPVIGFFGFWAVMALIGFSYAGEKMPWLTTHITLPLILLSGWSIGRFIDGTDWGVLRERRGWLVAGLLPVTVAALSAALGSLLGNAPPFQGSELPQLQATGVFLTSLLVTAICGVALYVLGIQLGGRHVVRLGVLWGFALLALLTARAAFVASYINYDSANEFLVYAHGAQGVRTVSDQVEELSTRLQDGKGMKVAYGSPEAWPMTWYFRNFSNQAYYGDNPTREQLDAPAVVAGPKNWSKVESILGNRYFKFEYIRMVWPVQDYFNLTWERVTYALSNPQYRQALWNIWYKRDYTLYGTLTKTTFDLSQWPVAERMRLYVRKDIASQIWTYGVGPTELDPGTSQEDPYVKSRQVIPAVTTWGSEGAEPGQFMAPRAVAAAPDGSVYVADSRNHRIQKFDANGQLLTSWGTFGSLDANTAAQGTFNEPWGVAVAPDGSEYVADTWNHRIQKFDANGQFLAMWGRFGQAETPDAFWGPRAVAVDKQGHVYVADTGNKRIAIFDGNGLSLGSIGAGGSDPGQLDEPVGVAVGADGSVFVADTWNQRIQVFTPDGATGEYLFAREWTISGWFGQSLDNKPYLALDAAGRLYVTDPEGYRILVFASDGKFLTTWGDFGSDNSTFALVSGIAVDTSGNIYVSDGGNQRLMKFPPLP